MSVQTRRSNARQPRGAAFRRSPGRASPETRDGRYPAANSTNAAAAGHKGMALSRDGGRRSVGITGTGIVAVALAVFKRRGHQVPDAAFRFITILAQQA